VAGEAAEQVIDFVARGRRQRDRGLALAALVRMPRRIITYLRTARPRPGCCS
jgi:hypothetical protein